MTNYPVLTFDRLMDAWDVICPKLYYTTDENIDSGKILLSKATPLTPEFFICHPDDLQELKWRIRGRQLVHLRDYKPRN